MAVVLDQPRQVGDTIEILVMPLSISLGTQADSAQARVLR